VVRIQARSPLICGGLTWAKQLETAASSHQAVTLDLVAIESKCFRPGLYADTQPQAAYRTAKYSIPLLQRTPSLFDAWLRCLSLVSLVMLLNQAGRNNDLGIKNLVDNKQWQFPPALVIAASRSWRILPPRCAIKHRDMTRYPDSHLT